MPIDPIRINVPHTLLRFVEYEGFIYYMDVPIYENLIPAPLDFQIPIVEAVGLHSGGGGVRCGYRFSCPPKLTRKGANYLIVCREKDNTWEPLLGVRGLQVFTSDAGVALFSTRITPFLVSLQ